MWFSWFNLIGISLIAYYRKNVFNTKVHLTSSISNLLYLMWLGYINLTYLQNLEKHIKIAMLCFVAIICIKNKLNIIQSLIVIGLSIANQFCSESEAHQHDQLVWLVFCLTIFFGYGFLLAFGQNNEVIQFSVFALIVQCGLINKFIDITHPLALSLIIVTLIFGPTVYELLELNHEF